ncbi:UPF0449 protein C19orf25 homolog [Stigmatopora nigra]
MNASLKGKKRAVLASRPSPPSADHILEDVGAAEADDPVFGILHEQPQQESEAGDVERTFRQCRRHADVKRQLRESEAILELGRERLTATGQRLGHHAARVREGLS